jgi:DnaJ-class molecular chaperone
MLRYTPNVWGGHQIGEWNPPAHVVEQVHRAFNEVDKHAENHADLHGGLAEMKDIEDDLRRVPSDMAAEQKSKQMFRNLLNSANETTCPNCDGEGNTEHGPKSCVACGGTGFLKKDTP